MKELEAYQWLTIIIALHCEAFVELLQNPGADNKVVNASQQECICTA